MDTRTCSGVGGSGFSEGEVKSLKEREREVSEKRDKGGCHVLIFLYAVWTRLLSPKKGLRSRLIRWSN